MIYACMLGAVCGASAFWAYLLVAWLSGNFALALFCGILGALAPLAFAIAQPSQSISPNRE